MKTAILYIIGIIVLSSINAEADRIKYFQYEACYWDVPVRETPSATAHILFVIPQYTVVRVSAQDRYWIKVVYRDENNDFWTGWAASTMMCPIDR